MSTARSMVKSVPWEYVRHWRECADICMADAHVKLKQGEYEKAIEMLEMAIEYLRRLAATGA